MKKSFKILIIGMISAILGLILTLINQYFILLVIAGIITMVYSIVYLIEKEL